MDYVTVSEFATIMGISTRTVYRLIAENAIPYYRVGKNIRLRVDDFKEGSNDKLGDFTRSEKELDNIPPFHTLNGTRW